MLIRGDILGAAGVVVALLGCFSEMTIASLDGYFTALGKVLLGR
jgi:hypothetical protein